MELPEKFKSRMRALLGAEYEDFLASYEQPSLPALRKNTLKTSSFPPCCIELVPWCALGAYYEGSPGRSILHEAGAYYIQEPSAMAVVTAANIKAGEKVLDLCAAPGGKSTHAACFSPSLLVANEIVPSRAVTLGQNIERCGISDCVVTNASPALLADKWGEFFDVVIADVPCSGEGMFRRREIAVREWSEENCALCAMRDADILESAARLTAPGGRIVYSTCTFNRAENEDVIEKFLLSHGEFSLSPTPLDKTAGMTRGIGGIGLRLYPHKLRGEGHFLCVLKKADGTAARGSALKRTAQKQAVKAFEEFSKDALKERIECDLCAGNTLYRTPKACPDLSGVKYLRVGLPLGTFERGRFTPHHSLALALSKEGARQTLDLVADEKPSLSYLHGETLPADLEDGWTLVTVSGISLGWGKAVGGVLKNFYPKGLRK